MWWQLFAQHAVLRSEYLKKNKKQRKPTWAHLFFRAIFFLSIKHLKQSCSRWSRSFQAQVTKICLWMNDLHVVLPFQGHTLEFHQCQHVCTHAVWVIVPPAGFVMCVCCGVLSVYLVSRLKWQHAQTSGSVDFILPSSRWGEANAPSRLRPSTSSWWWSTIMNWYLWTRQLPQVLFCLVWVTGVIIIDCESCSNMVFSF